MDDIHHEEELEKGSSVAHSDRSTASSQPTALLGFHRESPKSPPQETAVIESEEQETRETQETEDVQETEIPKVEDICASEQRSVMTYDGREVQLQSQGVQTVEETEADLLSRARSVSSRGGLLADNEELEPELALEPETETADAKSMSAAQEEVEDEKHSEVAGEIVSRKKSSSRRSSGRRSRSSRSRASRASALGGRISGRSTRMIPPYPLPYIDDEYGIPLRFSDDDDDDDELHVEIAPEAISEMSSRPEGRIARQVQAAEEGIIPSVGPPHILQYIRETDLDKTPLRPESPASRLKSMQLTPGGSCQFCGRVIAELPSLEDQMQHPPQQLYCCQEYRALLEVALAHPLNQVNEREVISLTPHAPFGNIKARKEAKDREEKRQREKERMRQQQQALEIAQQKMQQAAKKKVTAEVSYLSRQMKTINFQLSSLRCLEEGWTLHAPSPRVDLYDKSKLYEMDLDQVNADSLSARDATQSDVMQKYYPSGQKFLTVFRDGSGNMFYPSGNTAVVMTTVQPGQIIYVVFDDLPHLDAPILAVFDTAGQGSCYYSNGSLRLCYDVVEGMELDRHGARKRHWLWAGDGDKHSHAPPFQPICCGLNRAIGLRMTSREVITVNLNTHARSAKLQVGAKLRLVDNPALRHPPVRAVSLLNPADLRLEELRLRAAELLQKSDHLCQHPNHPRPEKLPTSLFIENRRMKLEHARQPLVK